MIQVAEARNSFSFLFKIHPSPVAQNSRTESLKILFFKGKKKKKKTSIELGFPGLLCRMIFPP
jgi:hypothetical protein